MFSVPWGAILLLLAVDALIAVGVSMFVGLVVACAVDRPARVGLLIGGLVPFAGPIVLGLTARRAVHVEPSHEPRIDVRLRWAAIAAIALSGLGMIVAGVLPWVTVTGNIAGSSAAFDGSAMDTFFGAFALVLSALLLLVCAASLVRWPSTAGAVIVVLVSATWLAITLDSFILYSGLNSVVSTVAGLDQGKATADLSAGSGAWLVLVASGLSLAAGIVLGVLLSRPGEMIQVDLRYPVIPETQDFGYGDGF